jgi:hypothetical protein
VLIRKDHFQALNRESGSPDENRQIVRNEGALLIRSFLEFLLESIQSQDGQTLMSNHAMADESYEQGTVVKDFEIFMDNRPSQLYYEALNIPLADKPEVKIKPKQKKVERPSFKPKINKNKTHRRDPSRIGDRLMTKGEEYKQRKQI